MGGICLGEIRPDKSVPVYMRQEPSMFDVKSDIGGFYAPILVVFILGR